MSAWNRGVSDLFQKDTPRRAREFSALLGHGRQIRPEDCHPFRMLEGNQRHLIGKREAERLNGLDRAQRGKERCGENRGRPTSDHAVPARSRSGTPRRCGRRRRSAPGPRALPRPSRGDSLRSGRADAGGSRRTSAARYCDGRARSGGACRGSRLPIVRRHRIEPLVPEGTVDQYRRGKIGRKAAGRAKIILRSRDE